MSEDKEVRQAATLQTKAPSDEVEAHVTLRRGTRRTRAGKDEVEAHVKTKRLAGTTATARTTSRGARQASRRPRRLTQQARRRAEGLQGPFAISS